MSTKNKELFKEAIADAQAVRQVALANAKAALEEALTPQIQAMFANKLQEMEDDDINESTNDELDEDLNLDEMLAEMDEDLDEAEKKDDKKPAEKKPEAKKPAAPAKPKEDSSVEGGEDEEELGGFGDEGGELVKDLSVEDLKMMITDIVSQCMGGGAEGGMGAEDGLGDDAMADINGSEGGEDHFGGAEQGLEGSNDGDEDLDLDELMAELNGLDEVEEEVNESEAKEELKEAIKTVKHLRAQLHEVNLLNAKLLYVNKIFKAKNLNESQKIKVIETLDKAESTKEAKLVYESLIVSFSDKKVESKQNIRESLGFASKASGVAGNKKAPIVEDEAITRFQKLANIK